MCVVGRSEHGKTTLLRVLAGLQPPNAGAVKLGDTTVMGPVSDRAMVFQQDTVFPWLRVRDNVEFGFRATKLSEGDRNEITKCLVIGGWVEEFADSWSRKLSGGMRKRVALVSRWRWVRMLSEVLWNLWVEIQKTSIFVTDDIEEALILADRAILLAECKLVNNMAVTLPRPRDEAVRASAEAVGVFKILAHLGITEEEGTTV